MIKALGLFYTFACPSACQMCVTSSSPSRKEKMSFEEAKKYIQQTISLPSLLWISINGGEPLLHDGEICRLIDIAKTNGKKTKISTNCFWAENRHEARRMIKRLKSSGLDFMSLSTDVYHQDFIPLENIRHCLDAAADEHILREVTIVFDRETEEEAFRLARALGDKNDEPFLGKVRFFEEDRSLEIFDQKAAINMMPLQPFGRGGYLDYRCFVKEIETLRESSCSLVGTYPYVIPGGTVYWCCNFFRPLRGYVKSFQVGSLRLEPLAEIENKLRLNPLVDRLSTKGPSGLPRPLVDFFYLTTKKDKFAGLCDLCQSIFMNEKTVESYLSGQGVD